MEEILDLNGGKMNANNIRIKLPRPRYEKYDSQRNIKSWGDGNLYPQKLKSLITLTPTASICYSRYRDFIFGNGIEGGDECMVNPQQSLNDVLYDACNAMAMFHGADFHVCRNAFGQIVGIRVLPFETLRLGEDDDFGYVRDYAYNPDWSGSAITRNKRNLNLSDTVRFYPYNDDPAVAVQRIGNAGGLQAYRGEILYLSNTNSYPIGPADAILTDMSTESGLQNISYRNSRSSFKPSAIIAYKAGSEDSNRMFERTIADMVGDETSSGVATVKVRSFDDMPKSLELKTENFDKAYETTANKGEERIYSAFKQETFYLLRIGKVGFGGDVEADAFNLMNICVQNERKRLERALKRIALHWAGEALPEIKIQDLLYKKDDSLTSNTDSNVNPIQ